MNIVLKSLSDDLMPISELLFCHQGSVHGRCQSVQYGILKAPSHIVVLLSRYNETIISL